MRFIKNLKQLIKLNRCKVIENDMSELISKNLGVLDKEYDEKLGGIIVMEEGDMLRGMDLFGLDTCKRGIIGINFEKVISYEDIFRCDYMYNNKYMILLIYKHLCDEEVSYLLNLYS